VVALLAAWFERGRGWAGLRDPEEPWPRHPRFRSPSEPSDPRSLSEP